ncbi:hypothetical protein [Acidiferrobacter sp.]|uniref:hypothetical protein n=1 Tax=Acidiferrobacter sp. TaxID=1872107 RepID=UPI003443E2F9
MLSEATILKYVLQLHQALARWEQMAIERLLTLPALHVDETSLRVDKHKKMIVPSGPSADPAMPPPMPPITPPMPPTASTNAAPGFPSIAFHPDSMILGAAPRKSSPAPISPLRVGSPTASAISWYAV